MSKRDAKLLARSWADDPRDLIRDLRELIDWVEASALTIPADAALKQRGALMADPSAAADVLQRVAPIESAMREYRRLMPPTPVNIELLEPISQAFSVASETGRTDVLVENITGIRNAVSSLEQWARWQSQKMSDAPDRSELLKTTIEEVDDEIIVRTDTNGSLKLRGSMSIPMFLALWKAPKHRLSTDAFLDIDRRTSQKNLDRHRARLCSRLQGVLLEVVADESGVRMQKCK